MVLRIQIAKFKFCQYLLKANLPNVILAKVIPTIWYFTTVIIIITCMKLIGQEKKKLKNSKCVYCMLWWCNADSKCNCHTDFVLIHVGSAGRF